jgi:hypothetical protein
MATKEELNFQVNSNIGEVSKEIGTAADNTKKLDKAAKDTGDSFSSAGKAVRGLGAAIKGAGVALAVATLAAFANVFRQNQKVIDFFNVTLKVTSIAFNDLFRFLDNNIEVIVGYLKNLFTDPIGELYKLGQAIQRYFVENLEGVVKLMKAVSDALVNVANPKKFITAVAQIAIATKEARKDINKEFDEMISKVTEYTSSIIGSANAMVLLDKEAKIAVAQNKILLEQKDREAELLRQIRDDETKTFAERIKANEDLGKVLDEQQRLMTENADLVVKAAQNQFALTENEEDYLVLLGAQAEAAGVLAQIEGFRSEQKINAVALNKEEQLVAQENADAQLAAFSQLAGSLGALAGDNKELAAAGALIDTYAGANKAFAQGGVAGFATGAAIIAAGLANLQKIYDTDVGTGGGSAGAAPMTPSPQMVGGAFELGGGVTPEPLRAYVLTDEMSNSQNQLANIRRRATI